MDSIIQKNKECFVCHSQRFLEVHHVLFGRKNHDLSEEYGLVVYLCPYCHRGNVGVHRNRDLDLKLKRIAEKAYLEHYDKTIEDFIAVFGRNYL